MRHKSFDFIGKLGVVAPLIALWIFLSLSTDRFLTVFNLNNIAIQFAIIGAMAIGTTAVIICREIDLSIGAIQGLVAVIAAILTVQLALPWPVAILMGIAVGASVGAVSGWFVVTIGMPSFVVTLGVLGVVSGISLTISGGQSIYGFPDAYQWIGQGRLFGVGIPVLISVACLCCVQFVLKKTRLGLGFYAVGGNEKASVLVGVPARRIKFFAFILSGMGASVAGILVSARLNAANATFGSLDLLDSIAAVVIGGVALSGGVGSAVGTAVGGLLIVSIRNGVNLLGVNPFIQQSAIGALILVAALLDHLSKRRAS